MSEVFTLSDAALASVARERGRTVGGAVVGVVVKDAASAGRLGRVLASVVSTAEASEAIGEAMQTSEALPGPATLQAIRDREQAWRDVASRYGLLTSQQVGANAGVRGAAEWASQRLRSRQVIAVKRGGRNLFPGFQFDERGEVRAGLARVIEAFDQAGWDAESVMLWFTAPSGTLDDAEPATLLATDPDAVLDAALDVSSSL
ncbi:MAG: hypothetical protein ACRDQA_09875 [Nocardioidaceae bacterium]